MRIESIYEKADQTLTMLFGGGNYQGLKLKEVNHFQPMHEGGQASLFYKFEFRTVGKWEGSLVISTTNGVPSISMHGPRENPN